MNDTNQLLLHRLRNEFKLATGCTDPAAIASAVAQARARLDEEDLASVSKIEVSLSPNIFKNGFMVDIPGSPEKGLPMAAALGFVIGDPHRGFEIFSTLNNEHVIQAKALVSNNIVTVKQIENGTNLTIHVRLLTAHKEIEVLVKNDYLNTVLLKENNQIVFEKDQLVADTLYHRGIRFEDLFQFIEKVPREELDFVEKGLETNQAFLAEALDNPKGFQLGRSLHEQFRSVEDVGMKIRMKTASAVDSRMGGSTLPVMSSAGSGNLGLGGSIPMLVVAEHHALPEEKLWRGTALANLIHLYLKEMTGRLTSVCGGVLVAMGTSAAIVWMLGGSRAQMAGAINHIAVNLTGMICDGANYGCAFKVSTSAAEAYYAAILAMNQCTAESAVGIVAPDVEQTIRNVIDIFVDMNKIDPTIVRAMSG